MTRAQSSGWRNAGLLVAMLVGSCAPGLAQVVCNTAATAVNVRAGGAVERTADVVVTCTGGFPAGQGQTVQPLSWQLTFTQTATSRPLSNGWSEALLVVDEPQPSNQLACVTVDGVCPIIGTGTPSRTYEIGRAHV